MKKYIQSLIIWTLCLGINTFAEQNSETNTNNESGEQFLPEIRFTEILSFLQETNEYIDVNVKVDETTWLVQIIKHQGTKRGNDIMIFTYAFVQAGRGKSITEYFYIEDPHKKSHSDDHSDETRDLRKKGRRGLYTHFTVRNLVSWKADIESESKTIDDLRVEIVAYRGIVKAAFYLSPVSEYLPYQQVSKVTFGSCKAEVTQLADGIFCLITKKGSIERATYTKPEIKLLYLDNIVPSAKTYMRNMGDAKWDSFRATRDPESALHREQLRELCGFLIKKFSNP